jgi:hypothetical protein
MISLDKTYRTKAGDKVRLYAIHVGQLYAVHGAIFFKNGKWEAMIWTIDGKWNAAMNSDCDLIEVKPKRTLDVWLNVYSNNGLSMPHMTKENADASARTDRLACIHIVQEYEEGEGL